MRLTRSAAKRIAEIDAEFDNEAQHILRQNAPGRLLSLPPELRGLIFSFLFEDEPPKLMGDIYRRSTAMRDPPVLFVCHQLRDELLSYFYSRKVFHFNISFCGDLAKLERWVASIKNIPCKVQHMRKVTFFGRSLGVQASITVDFTKMKIIDARWTQHQNSAGRNPKPIHHHMGVRHCLSPGRIAQWF
ncbi:uncharacterized protein K489DRAFT_409290 [Dissoconium aciculare CBS 342.82]|uniref:F-box domain-containing protein n=1 Tax=Dissoconium aciculare CBS 342.82 TaxID=1314786 RepID=A0A6J3M5W6_9PEZI|nr:uncharacterized protein K489DRAFT_409290 [Dissoconium aciculare CBS 342.82]KAF1823435.1 hypothetical protein K489DRAFT_409290 [Dissoconium aciculare CBS 342.82]